jgi:hypothetical protein
LDDFIETFEKVNGDDDDDDDDDDGRGGLAEIDTILDEIGTDLLHDASLVEVSFALHLFRTRCFFVLLFFGEL